MLASTAAGEEKAASNSADPLFLLTNKRGSFALLAGDTSITRYNGCYLSRDLEFYKVIEDIRPINSSLERIENSTAKVLRYGSNSKERFFMNHKDALLYEVQDYKGYVDVVLDCRKMHDHDDTGRIYSLQNEDGCLVIEYIKYKDTELRDEDYRIYLAVAGAKEYYQPKSWEKRYYSMDRSRGSRPWDWYVYRALRLNCESSMTISFGFSLQKEEAIENAKHTLKNSSFLEKTKDNYLKSIMRSKLRIPDQESRLAYRSSQLALDSLITNRGIFAGIPWFTQVWTRDEALCVRALILEEQYDEAKSILFRQLDSLLADGRIGNRQPHSELGSADGVGLVFLRLHDLVERLKDRSLLEKYLSHDELSYIQKRLQASIERLLACHSDAGLIRSEPLETWMDTGYKDDVRAGFRIEIQALQLAMYRLMAGLCSILGNEPKFFTYNELEHVTKETVKKSFWKRPILYDGKDDPTVRPNIFLAYYAYPSLLSKRQWTACFDNALKALWLDWGGLSTIDKNHSYFVKEYTGEDNRSYHRGDSWYFVNNLAGLCLARHDLRRYKSHVEKIREASAFDILSAGVIGYCSEVSSASHRQAAGCLAQAWSSATFIELMHELYQ